MEANHCYNPPEDCEQTGILPIYEYPNDANYMKVLTGMDEPNVDGCSVTGGYVYRGENIPDLQGTYFLLITVQVISGHLRKWMAKPSNLKTALTRSTLGVESLPIISLPLVKIIMVSYILWTITE